MKKQKPKALRSRVRNALHEPRPASRPAGSPARPDILEAALGVAARIAAPYPEEAEAVDNVIRFVRDHGRDVLLALSIVITAFDRDFTPAERQAFGMLDALLGIPARIAPNGRAAPTRPIAVLAHHDLSPSRSSFPSIRIAA